MKILDVVQGSPEWHAARGTSRGASEAPAMMGASKKTSRSELVRMKATGDAKEFSQWARDNLIERGHEVEAFARLVIEEELGEALYPIMATDDAGYLCASPDGVTMDGKTGFECKLWNEELAAAVRAMATEFPDGHEWQMEQQILVCEDMERVIFVVTDGTREKFLKLVYMAVRGRAKQLLAGWKQLDEDVANYKHVDVLPPVTAEPVLALPALAIDVKGEVELVSNLDKFGEQLKAFIAGIPAKPATDQEFANCEAAVKILETAQERLELAESTALARFESIDEMRRTVAMYRDLARNQRLLVEKLVESRKKEIRAEILRGGAETFATHVHALNTRLGKPYMPTVPTDFPGVMKGKKSIASLRDAVATELARARIAANQIADQIQVNLNLLAKDGAEYEFLFADVAQIALKANDDFAILVKARIAEHKAKKEAELANERERIRLEEEAKARFAVQSQAAHEQPRHDASTLVRAAENPLPPLAINRLPGAVRARPSDDEIVTALAEHFRTHESSVLAWLLDMDLKAVSKRLTEFAA